MAPSWGSTARRIGRSAAADWRAPALALAALCLCAAAGPRVARGADDGFVVPNSALDSLRGMGTFLPEGYTFEGGVMETILDEKGGLAGGALLNYGTIMGPGMRLSARNIVLRIAENGNPEFYAEGDVTFAQTGAGSFQCDRLIFDPTEWTGFATGVRVKSGEGVYEPRQRSFLSAMPQTSWRTEAAQGALGGGLGDAFLGGQARLYASAQELRILGRDHYELIDASVSTDSYAEPHWRFHIPAGLLRQYEKIEAYHSTVRIGKLPVFYLPYLIRDLRYNWPWMNFNAGSDSDWGYFLRTKWGFDLPFGREWDHMRPERIFFDLDAYRDRGLALGASLRYRPRAEDGRSFGDLGAYNIFETWTSRGDDRHRALFDNVNTRYPGFDPVSYRGHNRTTAFWNHYQELGDHWAVLGDLRYYSDPDMPWEYDRENYLARRQPGLSFNIRRLDRDWALSLYTQKRLNTWQTQTEYLPELRIDVPGYQIADTPLYWTQNLRAGVVNRRFDKDLDKYGLLETYRDAFGRDGRVMPWNDPVFGAQGDDDYGYFFRAFGDTRIEAPLSIGGALVVKPWVGARYGYYSDTYGEPIPYNDLPVGSQARLDRANGVFSPGQVREKGDVFDAALMGGVDLSTRAYLYFGDNDRWRWMVDPVVGVRWQGAQNHDQFVYHQIDGAENYGRDTVYRFGFHSRLETNSGGAPRDVLTFSAFLNHYPQARDQYTRHDGRDTSEIALDAIWRVTPKFTLWGNALVDTVYGRLNYSEAGGDVWVKDWFRVYAKHIHVGGAAYETRGYDPATDETVFAIRNKLWNDNSRYSSEVSLTYNWNDANRESPGGIAEYRVSLYRNLWDDFEMSVSYAQNRRQKRDEDGGRIDHGVYFSIAPTGAAGFRRPAAFSTLAASHIAESRYGYDPAAQAEEVASLRAASQRRAGAAADPIAREWNETLAAPPGQRPGINYY